MRDDGDTPRSEPPGSGGGASRDARDVWGVGGAAASSPPDDPEPDDGESFLSFLRELPVLLLIAFVLAFLLRTFVIQVFYIPSQSMAPTLQVDDRMVVEKITYLFREPRRGEIVVFEGEDDTFTTTEDTAQQIIRGIGQFLGVVPANARDFVKRIIGVPGDTVTIEQGVVHINGEPIDEPYVRFEDERSSGPFEVPDGKLFFLGDNRPNSSDSRFSLGFVDRDQVVGRAVVIIWPLEHAEFIDGADYDLEDQAGPVAPATALAAVS
ncbi:MAG: signal peptidase I [Nitriliruptorales bacterium]|nr:signal peptidase I [Nitriliruptorales bacterium]